MLQTATPNGTVIASASEAIQGNKQGLDCFRLRQKATADRSSQGFLAMTKETRRLFKSSFFDVQLHIGDAPLGAGPESITPVAAGRQCPSGSHSAAQIIASAAQV
jgi:hypothetical protein